MAKMVLDFKFSPRSESCLLSFGYFPGQKKVYKPKMVFGLSELHIFEWKLKRMKPKY
jgi:hypothetical protein